MRFLTSKNGTVHVVSAQISGTRCPVVTRALNAGTWKGQRSIKPEQVANYTDCAKCGSHAAAKEITDRSAYVANNEAEVKRFNDKINNKPKSKPKEGNMTLNTLLSADEKTRAKATEHAELAVKNGWAAIVTLNEFSGLTVIATRGEETCELMYREGGFLYNPGIVFRVPGRVVPLHNSGTWRRQVSLPDGKRPVSAKPKRVGVRPKDRPVAVVVVADPEAPAEEISLTRSSLPFPHDADDIVIRDAIKGKTLYWRNNMAARVNSAKVSSNPRLIRFGVTGKASRRYVSFPETEMSKDGEIHGPERSVAIEDMLRVKG